MLVWLLAVNCCCWCESQMCDDMKERGRNTIVKSLMVRCSTRRYRRKTARTRSVRYMSVMIETRRPHVMNGNTTTATSVTLSHLRWFLPSSCKHAPRIKCFVTNENCVCRLGYKMPYNIGEKFNRLSRVHERYRRQTDRRQTGLRRHILKRNVGTFV